MKVFILLTIVSLSLANEIFDVKNLKIENLKFELDKNVVDNIVKKYDTERGSEIIAVVNDYADLVFENIENLAIEDHLDPLILDDVEQDFLASSITLTNGSLNGIATIDRSDDVTVSYSSDSNTLEVYVPIIFSNLNFTFDYHVIILLIGPKGSMVGKIEDFRMNIRLQFDLNTYHAEITELTTANKGHVSLTFHGNGIVDLVVNILTEFVTAVLQPLIALIVESTVSDVADKVVQVINDAIDSIFNPGLSTTTVDSLINIF